MRHQPGKAGRQNLVGAKRLQNETQNQWEQGSDEGDDHHSQIPNPTCSQIGTDSKIFPSISAEGTQEDVCQ